MRYVVADGRESKGYDDIEGRSLIFSPDSRRVAFVGLATKRRWGVFKTIHSHTVVIDGQDGENYDAIIPPPGEGSINFMIAPSGGGSINFDSYDQFHYIARKGNQLLLVEERLQ